jgi:hypothetical protein
MAAWQEHMAGNLTWAEIGMTEHELLESIVLNMKMAGWKEHISCIFAWAEIGMTEHQHLESIL